MTIEVKVPLLPESVTDATVSTWHKKIGEKVSRDENIVDLETDKVMLEVPAPADGVLKEIIHQEGSTVQAEQVLAVIDTDAKADEDAGKRKASDRKEDSDKKKDSDKEEDSGKKESKSAESEADKSSNQASSEKTAGPAARRIAAEHDVDVSKLEGTGRGGRITRENVMSAISEETVSAFAGSARPEKRVPMTRMRARIAERLLDVTQSTAMLTTFNEINMQPVKELRSRYRDKFEKKYNVRLGFMSFFVRACVEALKRSPIVNASLDGNDVVYHGYYDVGVAVSTERGLVVPVLRDADKMSMAEIEAKIMEAAEKARLGKLSLEEMQGGTFTVTNGGVFGSLMSTPLLNAPQCAILGMHKIEDRAVVENGQVVVRPMMYVALSYDHRLIDGKESVTFLATIKDLLEDPARLILEI